MNDSYLDFANSALGAWLTNALGLPKPLVLERCTAGEAVIKGPVLLGGGGDLHIQLLFRGGHNSTSMDACVLLERPLVY